MCVFIHSLPLILSENGTILVLFTIMVISAFQSCKLDWNSPGCRLLTKGFAGRHGCAAGLISVVHRDGMRHSFVYSQLSTNWGSKAMSSYLVLLGKSGV